MSQAATEPPRKRQRVTQACHRCRRKKYKCDSERPTCSTCKSSDVECTYGIIAKRRGLQSGYVRATEILWGLVFKKVEGSQRVVNELLADLSNIISNGGSDGDHRADDLLDCWRNSGIPSAIELMLDGEFVSNQAGPLEDMDSQIDLTQASILTWNLPQPDQYQGTPPPALSPLLLPRAPSPLPLQQIPSPTTAVAAVSDALYPSEQVFATTQTSFASLPPDWQSLAQVYLAVEHSWFPMLERHALFRIAYSYQDESDHRALPDERHRGEYATLWAVLALGEIHSSGVYSPRVAQFKSISKYLLSTDPIPDDYLSHGQSLLLWCSIHLGCNRLVLARSMLAQAFVFCSASTSSSASGDPMFQRQRTLALAGCFVMDTLLSIAMGVRPQISIDDLPSSAPCDESGSDEWEPYVDKFGSRRYGNSTSGGGMAAPSRISSTFNHLVKLFVILNAVMQKQTLETDFAAAVETWSYNRPRHLTVTESLIQPSPKNVLPPQLHLLSFYSVISYIAASRQLYGQPHVLCNVLQQGPVKDIAGILLQISDRFGVQAMPVSMSVLILLVASESTPDPSDYGPTFTKFQDTITEYKAMWGWDYATGHEQHDLTGTTLIGQSDHHLLTSFTTQDLLHATMHDEAQHGMSTTTGLGTDTGQSLLPHGVASRQSDQVGMEMDLAATSYLDDAAGLGSDNPLADTPAQLRDYLALLQENERYHI
jgi:hypothetical protein